MRDDDRQWTIPFLRLATLRLPGGEHRLSVLGASGEAGYLESYLARFGYAPAEHSGQKKVIRPKDDGGWDIFDPDACPALAGAREQLDSPEKVKDVLLKCDWQLVGYTVHRNLVRLLFDPSGEGFWQIASWGFLDVSPDLKEGYFDFALREHTLDVNWVANEASDGQSTFAIAIARTLNVTSPGHGVLAFYDFELTVDRHIVPPDVSDLDGWPLTYWGTERKESAA
jgi:hypothetical protein